MYILRAVKLQNELFAIQRRARFSPFWVFCEGRCTYGEPTWGRTWNHPPHIIDYCVIPTEEEALMALDKTAEAIRKKRINQIKIVKVIKEIRV